MKPKKNVIQSQGILVVLCLMLTLLTGCSKSDSPAAITKLFWNAVVARDMETAKLYATWDTVAYLEFLNTEKLHPERFELGEKMLGDTRAEVDTTLFTSKAGESGLKLPGVTVLVKTDHGWRVNVKKSLASVVKYTTNTMFDQLNGVMQEGIRGLDGVLSESINELGKSLEKSAEELKRELSRPLFVPKN